MKKKKPRTKTELFQAIRRTWDCNPVTKRMPDKTKYTRKSKYKDEYSTDVFLLRSMSKIFDFLRILCYNKNINRRGVIGSILVSKTSG